MQKVIFNKDRDSSVVNAEDVVEEGNKIYAYNTGSNMKFLTNTDRYRWATLFLSGGTARGITQDGYKTFKEAIMACYDLDVIIFKNQCEVLDYVKKYL